MCLIFFERNGTLVTSYDFGGDGSVEYEALEIRADWTESDLVLQGGVTVATDQAAFDELTARLANGSVDEALSLDAS